MHTTPLNMAIFLIYQHVTNITDSKVVRQCARHIKIQCCISEDQSPVEINLTLEVWTWDTVPFKIHQYFGLHQLFTPYFALLSCPHAYFQTILVTYIYFAWLEKFTSSFRWSNHLGTIILTHFFFKMHHLILLHTSNSNIFYIMFYFHEILTSPKNKQYYLFCL